MSSRITSRVETGVLRIGQLARRAKQVASVVSRRRIERAFDGVRSRFYADLWERTARSVGARFSPIGHGFFRITRGDRVTFVDSSGAFVDSRLGAKMALNKVLMHSLFEDDPRYRAPGYCSYALGTIDRAYAFLDRAQTPVVVKPARGGFAGRGVTAGIEGHKELRRAALHAAAFSSHQMVEQHIRGRSYRLVFLQGALIGTLYRGPPTVVGNGRDGVRKLMQAETARRHEGAEIRSLHPLQPDLDCRLTLRSQGLSLSSVPPPEAVVEVKTVVNQSAARDNERVSLPVHESLLGLGARISSLLQLPLVALDVITSDLAVGLAESGGVVNEVNAQPGLHHHYLVRNPSFGADVAAAVLEVALGHAPQDRGPNA